MTILRSPKYIFIVILYFNYITPQNDDLLTTELTIKSCRGKNRLIGSNKTDLYDVTEAIINETIILECHYCNDKDEHEPKIWYKINQFNKKPNEVELDMHNNEKLNRISVSIEHSLIIHNATINDTGMYYCQGIEKQDTKDVFNFIVDISMNSSNLPEKGNMSHWKIYHDDYILPINEKLLNSNETDYFHLRNDLKTQLEVISDWESDFGPCEVCGRPRGEGIQKKIGFCRIKIENNGTDNVTMLETVEYFLSLPKVSCRSFLFAELFPDVSKIVKNIKDYILIKKCEGACNPDAEGINQGWKFSSSKNFKYRKTMVLEEGAHLTLICPESTLENTIIWRRNGKALSQGEAVNNENNIDSIHIVVDAFNSLYLIHVTGEEEGNYTCQVDNIRMLQIRVFVKTKSRLLSEEFVRHMRYLAFILFMSFTCYIAGVISTCKKRRNFKSYEEIISNQV